MAVQEPQNKMSLDELDQALLDMEQGPAGEAPPEMADEMIDEGMDAGMDEIVDEEIDVAAEVDLSPLMDNLGVTEERAQMLYDAAQELGATEGKTPEELADMIANDFDVLMQLEMLAARGESAPTEPAAAEPMPEMPGEEMMAPEGI
tara:strand:- start:241 stop:681 length:441 start_codon:yes stop_codon:yes gene_type:complete